MPMPIAPDVLQMLACPVCKTEVRLTSDGAALVCGSCRRRYLIADDIPNFLVEEATLEPEERP